MSILEIAEYKTIGGPGEKMQIPQEPPIAFQQITYDTTSGASAALHAETQFVSIQLSANGRVKFAASPTATSTTSRIHEANAVSFHGVTGGLKIAAVST